MKIICALILTALFSRAVLAFDVREYDGAGMSIVNDSLSWKVGGKGLITRRKGKTVQAINITFSGFKQSEWDFTDVSFPDEGHGWVVGYKNCVQDKNKGIILYTYNGGAGWYVSHATCVPGLINAPDSLTPFFLVMMVKMHSQYQGYVLGGNDVLLRWNPMQENWVRTRPYSTALDSLKVWYRRAKGKQVLSD